MALISKQMAIDRLTWYDEEEHMHPGFIRIEHVLRILEDLPSIEGEIVLCKECRHRAEFKDALFCCRNKAKRVDGNSTCKYGRRG